MSIKKRRITVLLVDDEREFLEAMCPVLENRDFNVMRAENGHTALKVLRKNEPDVVVLDVKMPDMDGISVFNNIKRDWPSIPVILLTGHGTIQEAFETSKRGVFEYLSKPCDIEKLADMLRRAEESRIKKD